ncbi:hypothetical protein N7462_002916 [Penicillium macrosclerotiorum]|uniref:uncharacterized protein n=1 Tax=Penicillium macrosclerotiorum TaxID=303699 RepID=UPI00254902C8|nr:uncharacterized protein N7462_002916 [Penicillium macrosclerotiorum]KAJ5688524.1 hypothetical protein N7462_002916 [Penicillium macrosclerotiorum]
MEQDKKALPGLSRFFQDEVEPRHADLLLFTCCLSSGLVDSTIYNAYNTFVSMQTGNTIFVGLGASNQNPRPYGWARSLTSIGCFILGCFLFARLSRIIGARRRGSLMLSFLLQSMIIIITAGLVQGGVISSAFDGAQSSSTTRWDQEVPIVLLSLQSAGQIVASRALGFNEIPTVVITSLLCDLMSDPKLFLLRNEKRDRRVIAFVLTLLGAIIGGWVTKATAQITPILWLSAGIKMLVVVAWGFWRTKP